MSEMSSKKPKDDQESPEVARIVIIGIVVVLFSAYVADLFSR